MKKISWLHAIVCCALLVLPSVRSLAAESTIKVCAPGEEVRMYDLSKLESAKAYINEYADNVQHDCNFREHERQALSIIRTVNPFFGGWWSVFPPLLAILLTLITKEVYSSLFAGIVAGGVLYSNFSFEGMMVHVLHRGFVCSIADVYNVGILLFLVFLGALVAMMSRTGASAAFGRWARQNIKSRTGAQFAAAFLGVLIFIDDYFNCLTVGGVMRPVTDAKRISRAKLAYLIDATAGPICIIAPISSWAAAVSGFAKGAGAESGLALFVSAIPFNYYALLTIIAMITVVLLKLDYGPMKRIEAECAAGSSDVSAVEVFDDCPCTNSKGRIYDLFVPMMILMVSCVIGMVYTGGYFGGKADGDFVQAFAQSDASIGLVYGAVFSTVVSMGFFLCRRVISFKECMASFPQGFKVMVPAIMILCCAWTLKSITDSLGAKIFISDIINGSAASLVNFLPAIVFTVAAVLAFSTGTSWGTFGILIPIVLAAVPESQLTVISIAACMAGAVCGDHASPISDTTIMASAGAQCNHVIHVGTQLPYVLPVALVSFVSYLIAPFIDSIWGALVLSVVLMLAVLVALKLYFVKFAQRG